MSSPSIINKVCGAVKCVVVVVCGRPILWNHIFLLSMLLLLHGCLDQKGKELPIFCLEISMADIETKASENMMEACTATLSVTKCVFTSSLLACIWRDPLDENISSVINHRSWSDESVCINKKVWYALGKLRAEKAAWRIAKENELKLTTISPGLVTGPDFCLQKSNNNNRLSQRSSRNVRGKIISDRRCNQSLLHQNRVMFNPSPEL